MHSSQHSKIELIVNIVDPSTFPDEKKPFAEGRRIWSRAGAAGQDVQLNTGEGEKFRFSTVTQNASVSELYTQSGLEPLVRQAVSGVNVSLLCFGAPQGNANIERTEAEERSRVLGLAQRVLRTIVGAPERRERYCAATVVQIDTNGTVHPFDSVLLDGEDDGADAKQPVRDRGGLPFSLWHGDHGIVLPPEIFQEMCCQQDIDHFFTLHRAEAPASTTSKGELFSMDDIQNAVQAIAQEEGKDTKFEFNSMTQRSTYPHAQRNRPREAAVLFVAEVFQSVSTGHDRRSTVLLLYLPQRAENEMTRSLWTGLESLLEHGKWVDSGKSVEEPPSPGQHPVASICQHILYGGGVSAALFTIPNGEKYVPQTLSLLHDMKILRVAKLLVPINYYDMPACATEAIAQFKQFQKMIKRELNAAFAAGMYDGWQLGLKSAQKVVDTRRDHMHHFAQFYIEKLRDAVLPRYETLANSIRAEAVKRQEVLQAQNDAQGESEHMLEAKSRTQAQIDSVIAENARCQEDAKRLTQEIERNACEVSENEERKRALRSEADGTLTELQHEIDQADINAKSALDDIQCIRNADERAVTEHEVVFSTDYTIDVESKCREKEALLEKLRDLESDPHAGTAEEAPTDELDPLMTEIKDISMLVANKEQELSVIQAQIAVLQRTIAARDALPQQTPMRTEASPGPHIGELSRFLAPQHSSIFERIADAHSMDQQSADDFLALSNISFLIEQSPFDPHRLKKSDLMTPVPKPAFEDTPVKRRPVAQSRIAEMLHEKNPMHVPNQQKGAVNASLPESKATAMKTLAKPVSSNKAHVVATPLASRLRSAERPAKHLVTHVKSKLGERKSHSRLYARKSKRKSRGSVENVAGEKGSVPLERSLKKHKPHPVKQEKRVKSLDEGSVPSHEPHTMRTRSSSKPDTDTSKAEAQRANGRHGTSVRHKPEKPAKPPTPINRGKLTGKASSDEAAASAPLAHEENRVTTPSKTIPTILDRKNPAKPDPMKALEKIAQKARAKRETDRKKREAVESRRKPGRVAKTSQGKSSGVILLPKSAKKFDPAKSMEIDSVGNPSSEKSDMHSSKDNSMGRKLEKPPEQDESPGKLPSVGTIIRNFISNGADVIQKTVNPRVLDFAEKSNDLFSFLKSESSVSEVIERDPSAVKPHAPKKGPAKRAHRKSLKSKK